MKIKHSFHSIILKTDIKSCIGCVLDLLYKKQSGCSVIVDKYEVANEKTSGIHRADMIVSWNFKHIVHFDKIRGFNAVNIREGYALIAIHSPKEVV